MLFCRPHVGVVSDDDVVREIDGRVASYGMFQQSIISLEKQPFIFQQVGVVSDGDVVRKIADRVAS